MANIILLGLTSLLMDFSSEMVVPILPFFIQSVGGAGVAIGLIFGVGDAVAALLKVISGYWADRNRRYKIFVFGGYLFSAVAKFFYPISGSWQQVSMVRAVERLGKGFRDAPRDAIVSESLVLSQRGKGFGIQRAMDSVGAIVGSVAVLILFLYAGLPFKTIFWISAFIALLAVIPIVFVRVPEHLKGISHKAVSLRFLSAQAKLFILIATLFALANFSVAFLILRTQMSFPLLGSSKALGLTVLLYIFFNLFDAILSGPAGSLSDRIGRRKVIFTGYIMFAAVMAGFLVSPAISGTAFRFIFLAGLFILYGAFKAFIDGAQRAFVSDLSPLEIRGTALGTFETFTGMAAIPSGLIAGVLWNLNPLYTFSFGAITALAAALLLRFCDIEK